MTEGEHNVLEVLRAMAKVMDSDTATVFANLLHMAKLYTFLCDVPTYDTGVAVVNLPHPLQDLDTVQGERLETLLEDRLRMYEAAAKVDRL